METTDVGLAAFIYSLGKDVEIVSLNEKHCIFRFEDCPEITEWQTGRAMVNGLAFLNCYKTLVRGVRNVIKTTGIKAHVRAGGGARQLS